MPILVYAESDQGIFKKSTQELISFARAIADQMNTEVIAAVTQRPLKRQPRPIRRAQGVKSGTAVIGRVQCRTCCGCLNSGRSRYWIEHGHRIL